MDDIIILRFFFWTFLGLGATKYILDYVFFLLPYGNPGFTAPRVPSYPVLKSFLHGSETRGENEGEIESQNENESENEGGGGSGSNVKDEYESEVESENVE